MKTRKISLFVGILSGILLLISGCATARCERVGQIIWEKGFNPEKNAPSWTKDIRKAARAVGVPPRQIPKKTIVVIGVSEDLNKERGASTGALDDMLQKYGAYLKEDLDVLMKQAAYNLSMILPNLDTALGAYNAVRYIPNQNYESEFVKASWQAHGKRCLESGEDQVFRVYLIGVFDKEARRKHIMETAKETFKYALVQKEKKNKILQELQELVGKY